MTKVYRQGGKKLYILTENSSKILYFVNKKLVQGNFAADIGFEVFIPNGLFLEGQDSIDVKIGHSKHRIRFVDNSFVKVTSYLFNLLPYRWFSIKVSESDIVEIKQELSNFCTEPS